MQVSTSCSQGIKWPSQDVAVKWGVLSSFCANMTDLALSMALTHYSNESTGNAATQSLKDNLSRIEKNRREGGDFSVAYALHYPNFEGGAPALPKDVAGEEGINVKVRLFLQVLCRFYCLLND
jgi:hypothetical protein